MYVHVRVIPGMRKERVVREDATKFSIEVREPAERNLANKRIQKILADEFNVSPEQVKMLTGHRSPSKMFSIEILGG